MHVVPDVDDESDLRGMIHQPRVAAFLLELGVNFAVDELIVFRPHDFIWNVPVDENQNAFFIRNIVEFREDGAVAVAEIHVHVFQMAKIFPEIIPGALPGRSPVGG